MYGMVSAEGTRTQTVSLRKESKKKKDKEDKEDKEDKKDKKDKEDKEDKKDKKDKKDKEDKKDKKDKEDKKDKKDKKDKEAKGLKKDLQELTKLVKKKVFSDEADERCSEFSSLLIKAVEDEGSITEDDSISMVNAFKYLVNLCKDAVQPVIDDGTLLVVHVFDSINLLFLYSTYRSPDPMSALILSQCVYEGKDQVAKIEKKFGETVKDLVVQLFEYQSSSIGPVIKMNKITNGINYSDDYVMLRTADKLAFFYGFSKKVNRSDADISSFCDWGFAVANHLPIEGS
ncbi:MAG: hypothetical protein S4CHLAM37_00990 [Chlamydiia bacterium]|nr:hypothetical protein [Chlamydiia bacterium]